MERLFLQREEAAADPGSSRSGSSHHAVENRVLTKLGVLSLAALSLAAAGTLSGARFACSHFKIDNALRAIDHWPQFKHRCFF